jgi:hypothetical protein
MKHKPNISYSHKDIERYLDGKMSREEMRKLELASLDDAFLADAIEGYMLADDSTTNKNIAAIEDHIQQNKKERKVIPLWNSPVFKIAAVLIILAGCTWLSFEFFNKSDQQLAETKTVEKPKEAAKKNVDTPLQKEETIKQVPQKTIAATKAKTAADQQTKEMQIVADEEIAMNDAKKRTSDYSVQAQKNVHNYSIENKATQSKVAGNINDYKPVGREIATANESFKNVIASSPPAAKPLTKADTSAALEGKSLNEVVVTGYATRNRRDMGMTRVINVTIDTINVSAPAIGWEKLKTEIKNSVKDLNLDSVTNVTISFTVNKNKNLRKIKTEFTDNEQVSITIINLIETKEYWLPSTERIRLVIRIY